MTRDKADAIRAALKVIAKTCREASNDIPICKGCPLWDACQGKIDLFSVFPTTWNKNGYIK